MSEFIFEKIKLKKKEEKSEPIKGVKRRVGLFSRTQKPKNKQPIGPKVH